MTDKQIMIDGCDVSGCKHYKHNDKNSGWSSCTSKDEEHIHAVNPLCCEKKDCLYKQLKRKEQECERLKSAFVRAECQIADDEILQCDMREAIEALKAENKHLNDLLNQALKELEKTRETLAEIKGLCQSMTDEFEEMDIEQQLCYCQQISKQILQKISEVEND